jgi:hypothetical protein
MSLSVTEVSFENLKFRREKNFSEVASPAKISLIHDKELNFLIWRREARDWSRSFQALDDVGFLASQMIIESGESVESIGATFDEEINADCPEAFDLYQDIMDMATTFFAQVKAKRYGVRLEKVSGDMCRLFHVDRVGVRLVHTYFGVATEWLANEDVIRSGLGQGDNSLAMRQGAIVRSLPDGAVGLMKGEIYPGNLGNGVVHRSPSQGESKSGRLLLRIDTLGEQEF